MRISFFLLTIFPDDVLDTNLAPKTKGKKGKKQDDDDFWEKAGTSIAGNNAAVSLDGGDASEDDAKPKRKAPGGFSAFATLGIDDGVAGEGEDEDFGGLMSVIKASAKNKKKGKKGALDTAVSFEDGPPPGAGSDGEAAAAKGDISAPKKAVEMTAEELADEEWGPVKEKGKKGKKAKGKKDNAQGEILDEEKPVSREAEPVPTSLAAPTPSEEDMEDEGPKVLSKKEKEKLKKEREKAKKKAQAAAKKVTQGDESTPAAPAPTVPPVEEEEEEGEAGGAKADSKKKKKKKAKKDDEVPAPAPAAGKKKGISALRALMEEKKRLEEEARLREEEERRRIEEEERKAEEEEKRKEEEKQRRKEKEKVTYGAKREIAKKEGRLLTKKQKEEQRAAELRKQALLASGVQIEGLQQSGSSQAPKKVVYGNRKKKGPASATESGPATREPSPVREQKPSTPTPAPASIPAAAAAEENAGELKEDWEASSDEEESKSPTGVKDSWDASSDEEEPRAPPAKATPAVDSAKTAPKAVAPEKIAPTRTSVKPAPSKTVPAKAANGKIPAAKEPEESEEDSGVSESESESESSSDEETSSESESDGMTNAQRMAAKRKAEAAERRAKAHEEALAARNKDNLRSPICCILGHVDTGKTKLLDKIRQTNVQEGEAGGITQQIGATYFPVEAIKTKTAVMNRDGQQEYKIPGLLIIDTPGHESFTNLRSRGSSLCNIAILVVDIMHGLEPQTLESLRLLRDRKTPFIVALNKIDRLYGWEATPDNDFRSSLAKQNRAVQRLFEDGLQKIILAFAEQGLNSVLYYENKNFARNVSIVPTSAITGEGVPDMIMLLVNLTQQRMSDRLMYLSELECTVLEVKVIEGLGTTIDVVLSNGILHEGDKIVVCGLNGPIVTQIRALLTPQPLRELRIKSAYVHHKEVKAALGVKLVAPDLEKAIAGSRLLVCGPDDDERLMDEVMSDLTTLLNSIDKSGRGVCVQASTLGSLEALLDFLKSSKIPVSGINIGPVHKRDIMRAATMLEKAKELACILCFDVAVDKDAERLAEEMGIRLFKADIIYHLFDAFTAYNNEIMEAKRKDAAPQAVWPCRLKTIAAFCKRDPIILGVDILDGALRVGTPICVVKVDPETQKKEIIDLGKITSLEINHKAFDIVKKSQAGGGVAVKIEHAVYQSAKMFGRHFDEKDELYSHITRQSIDVLKSSFKTDVSNEEWLLIKALKPRLNIQ
ncbi:Eukaryotic translation initiation factor 5B [Grifola frondosa]|uniref:Eukaryotic translation initiation factor 5B n=1 Tax=Grifola frondosa TaxID=5627 RepID=A0A1C7M564_GRIFR|nr:Eukaryotic translation initiation factor 5B [Grifola frondosa]